MHRRRGVSAPPGVARPAGTSGVVVVACSRRSRSSSKGTPGQTGGLGGGSEGSRRGSGPQWPAVHFRHSGSSRVQRNPDHGRPYPASRRIGGHFRRACGRRFEQPASAPLRSSLEPYILLQQHQQSVRSSCRHHHLLLLVGGQIRFQVEDPLRRAGIEGLIRSATGHSDGDTAPVGRCRQADGEIWGAFESWSTWKGRGGGGAWSESTWWKVSQLLLLLLLVARCGSSGWKDGDGKTVGRDGENGFDVVGGEGRFGEMSVGQFLRRNKNELHPDRRAAAAAVVVVEIRASTASGGKARRSGSETIHESRPRRISRDRVLPARFQARPEIFQNDSKVRRQPPLQAGWFHARHLRRRSIAPPRRKGQGRSGPGVCPPRLRVIFGVEFQAVVYEWCTRKQQRRGKRERERPRTETEKDRQRHADGSTRPFARQETDVPDGGP